YVRSDAIAGLPVAASFEPREALDGGPDGLDILRALLELLPDVLATGGAALLEIGADQGETAPTAVGELLSGWRSSVSGDLAGLRAARARGGSVSPVTGRMSTSAITFARELGLTDPIVAYQGALIRALRPEGDERLGRLLHHHPLGVQAARDVVSWSIGAGLE